MLDRDVCILLQFLKVLLYAYNFNHKWITLYCWLKIDSSVSVLLQARCHCTSGVQQAVYIESTYSTYVYAAVYDELLCEVT